MLETAPSREVQLGRASSAGGRSILGDCTIQPPLAPAFESTLQPPYTLPNPLLWVRHSSRPGVQVDGTKGILSNLFPVFGFWSQVLVGSILGASDRWMGFQKGNLILLKL